LKTQTFSILQLEQASAILTADISLKGAIRAWTCGIHGQKALTYDVSANSIQVRCLLCDPVNNWGLPKKQEKCLCCGLTLTDKEATENPEKICDACYEVGNDENQQECKSQKEKLTQIIR
jgi:hypothetical protein